MGKALAHGMGFSADINTRVRICIRKSNLRYTIIIASIIGTGVVISNQLSVITSGPYSAIL